jgi:hypothetical protein
MLASSVVKGTGSGGGEGEEGYVFRCGAYLCMCGMSSVMVVNGRLWRKRNGTSYGKCHGRETETNAEKE